MENDNTFKMNALRETLTERIEDNGFKVDFKFNATVDGTDIFTQTITPDFSSEPMVTTGNLTSCIADLFKVFMMLVASGDIKPEDMDCETCDKKDTCKMKDIDTMMTEKQNGKAPSVFHGKSMN